MNAELGFLRQQQRDIRSTFDEIKREFYARKAGFNQNQPRWPAGNGLISGRWSGGSGSGTQTINQSQTGISTIDNTTDTLLGLLANVIDFLPDGSGPLYGIAVHTVFGSLLRLGVVPGIGFGDVEVTFGGDGTYGSSGSVRTDAILRNDIGDPIAVYDVKTGDASLKSSRADELRDKVGASARIPVIELHVVRGSTVKGLRTFLLSSLASVDCAKPLCSGVQ